MTGSAVQLSGPLVEVLDLSGVAANALIGGALARAMGFDIVGYGVLAVVSGLGGGLLRDTLLQQGPPAALTHAAYLITALLGAIFAYFIRLEGPMWHHSQRWVDGLAVGWWAVVGAVKTLDAGLSWLPAIFIGTLTAVGGGLIRDVFVQRTPTIFGGNTLYATAALAASTTLVAFWAFGATTVGLVVASLVGAAICIAAYHFHWVLPPSDGFQPRLRRQSQPRDDR